MKKNKAFYISLSTGIVLLIIAIILGTIYDLEISKLFADLPRGSYYSNNIFAIIGEMIGENILYILLEVSFAILFYYFIRYPIKQKWLNVILIIMFALLGCAVSFYCINKTLEYLSVYTNFGLDVYLENTMGKFSVLAFSIVVNVIVFMLFSRVSKESIRELFGFAITVIIVSIISNVIVQGAKLIFDRTRYRAMMYEGYDDFEYYTNWYQINTNKFASNSEFYSDYFKSFPSGHTCAAASSFLLILLPSFYKKTNTLGWKITFTTFAILYTFLVGLSRIVAGAHYFTDVLFGGFITIACVLIAKWCIIDKLIAKQKLKEEQLALAELEKEKSKKKSKSKQKD